MKNYYHILDIGKSASSAEIRKRWKELARKYHPDHNPEDPLAESHFKEVQEAYRVLSDEEQRKKYDHGTEQQDDRPVHHYFFVQWHPERLLCFEEATLIFTYSGRGRVFRKPEMKDFFITGSPFVSQRMVIHEGRPIRETELTYIISPLKQGNLSIGKGSILIENQEFRTEPFFLEVQSNNCFFTHGNLADSKPFKLTLHYEYLPGEEPFRMSELKKNHIILVPRSRAAFIFHRIGSFMKLIFTIYGMIKLSREFDLNPLLGMAAGNLFAGINCYILYAIARIRPKYAAGANYSLAKDYRDRGYYLGESLGIPMISGSYWYFIGRMFR